MNRYSVILLVVAAVSFSSGCSSVPTKDLEFTVQADSKVDFGGYETYAWLGSAAILNDPEGRWEPPAFDADAEIKYLIDRRLRKRGMSERTVDPDMIVAYAAGIDMDALELRMNPQSDVEMLSNVPRGGLLVVLVDNASGFVIWSGVAVGDIQRDLDTETAKERLEYAVKKLFKELPK